MNLFTRDDNDRPYIDDSGLVQALWYRGFYGKAEANNLSKYVDASKLTSMVQKPRLSYTFCDYNVMVFVIASEVASSPNYVGMQVSSDFITSLFDAAFYDSTPLSVSENVHTQTDLDKIIYNTIFETAEARLAEVPTVKSLKQESEFFLIHEACQRNIPRPNKAKTLSLECKLLQSEVYCTSWKHWVRRNSTYTTHWNNTAATLFERLARVASARAEINEDLEFGKRLYHDGILEICDKIMTLPTTSLMDYRQTCNALGKLIIGR